MKLTELTVTMRLTCPMSDVFVRQRVKSHVLSSCRTVFSTSSKLLLTTVVGMVSSNSLVLFTLIAGFDEINAAAVFPPLRSLGICSCPAPNALATCIEFDVFFFLLTADLVPSTGLFLLLLLVFGLVAAGCSALMPLLLLWLLFLVEFLFCLFLFGCSAVRERVCDAERIQVGKWICHWNEHIWSVEAQCNKNEMQKWKRKQYERIKRNLLTHLWNNIE